MFTAALPVLALVAVVGARTYTFGGCGLKFLAVAASFFLPLQGLQEARVPLCYCKHHPTLKFQVACLRISGAVVYRSIVVSLLTL